MTGLAGQTSFMPEDDPAGRGHLDTLIRCIQDEVRMIAEKTAEADQHRRARDGAVLMAHRAGHSYDDIAARLGVAAGQVEQMAASAAREERPPERAAVTPPGDTGSSHPATG